MNDSGAIASRDADLKRILDTGIIAVVRVPKPSGLVETAEALVAGGVDLVEITFTVPRAAQVIEQIVARLGSRALVGAGTVLDVEMARAALDAGARYVVSPVVNLDVIRYCRERNCIVVPGAMTPTEVLTAWEAGAELIKVFPTEVVGLPYFKALRGPLPQVRLMPSGGVTLQTAADYLRAGAAVLAVGGSLVDPKTVERGDFQRIESLAREFVSIVREFHAHGA